MPRFVLDDKQHFLLQVGLDAAGKTTILYKLKLGEIVTTIPTIGELVDCLDFVPVLIRESYIGCGRGLQIASCVYRIQRGDR